MLLPEGNPVERTIRNNPWQSRTEYLVDDALMRATAGTDDEIRNMRSVAGVQNPFPERLGFTKEEWTIQEVLNVDRRTPTYRSWTSGFTQQRSVLSDQGAEASTRNSMGAMW